MRSSAIDISRLDETVQRLMPERDTTLSPRFFLASVTDQWIPRVVVVSRNDAVVGVVYAKERKLAGIGTGLFYLDGRLQNMAVADPDHQEEVIAAGIRSLLALPRARGLRLAIQAGLETRAVEAARSSFPLDVSYSSAPAHASLQLPGRYEDFLHSLGYRTRRNFRYYRRKFEDAGHTYAPDLSASDLQEAVGELRTKCRISSSPREAKRALDVVSAAEHRWAVGLNHRDGQRLSVAAGWHERGRATIFFQLNNDREYGAASLSVVLRANLIETLIAGRTRELVFWSGSAEPLSRYIAVIPTIMVHLDRPTLEWRLIRSVIERARPFLPKRIGVDLGSPLRPETRAVIAETLRATHHQLE